MKKIIWMVKTLIQHKGYYNKDIKLKLTTYQIEVAGCISKFLRKYSSIIKMYHYHSNSFHKVFT